FLWRDIAEIGIGADELQEVKLLVFAGGFPKDLFRGDLGEDLLHESFADFAGVAVEAYGSRLAGFGYDIRGAGIQLGLHQLYPLIGRRDVLAVLILRTDFAE